MICISELTHFNKILYIHDKIIVFVQNFRGLKMPYREMDNGHIVNTTHVLTWLSDLRIQLTSRMIRRSITDQSDSSD